MSFTTKLAVVVNKDIELGVAMNALAHCSLAIGALLGKDGAFLQDYKDASGNIWPLSGMPYIILKGKSGEMRKAVLSAKETGVQHLAFTETATGGSYEEQLARTAQVTEENHQYYALVLFGPWENVNAITKKFSLFK